MVIPAVVSIIVSALFFENPLSNEVPKAEIGIAMDRDSGSVLGVMERIKKVPWDFDKVSAFNNRLPISERIDISPKRKPGSESLNLPIASGIVIDKETNKPLWDRTSQKIRPIASISKLMTALVFLENNPGWDKTYKIQNEDRREGGRIYVYTGDQVRVRDLFNLSLVASANTATIALVHSTGMSEADFIKKMNDKARELGMKKTNFSDPSGLSHLNVSTAYEVSKMAKEAFAKIDIKKAVLTPDYSFETIAGRRVSFESTDQLLNVFPKNDIDMVGGKTGYTDPAGACFVGLFANNKDKEIISVVLGSQDTDSRFDDTKSLVEWVFSSYIW
ncbi:hypothetical protein GF382_02245 [Candidatus Falkowbacteria bacterium]|nr:hypothetical protein [Candidatus Falkowbacteria bacterium]